MTADGKKIAHEAAILAEPVISNLGMEMVDAEFKFENGRWILRIYIDKKGGVTLDDCVVVNRELEGLLDAKDIIDRQYVLEVSSPGLNRPLKKGSDFINSIGKKVRLRTKNQINKRRNFTGRIISAEQGWIKLSLEDDNFIELSLEEVEKARLKYEFNN